MFLPQITSGPRSPWFRLTRLTITNLLLLCLFRWPFLSRALQCIGFWHRDRFAQIRRFSCELALLCHRLDQLEGRMQLLESLVVRRNLASTVSGYSIDSFTQWIPGHRIRSEMVPFQSSTKGYSTLLKRWLSLLPGLNGSPWARVCWTFRGITLFYSHEDSQRLMSSLAADCVWVWESAGRLTSTRLQAHRGRLEARLRTSAWAR